MTRKYKIDGVTHTMKADEESARDAEEKAWADKAPERELKAFYDKRKSEYPTIEELVVALYDPKDKAEIDRRRAEVKEKFPKGAE